MLRIYIRKLNNRQRKIKMSVILAYQDSSKASLYAIGKQNDVVYFKKDKRAMAPPKASGSFFGFLLMYTFHG